MTIAEAAESGTVTEEAAREAAVSSQENDKAIEAEAREYGWVPEEEFKGDRKPKVFKTAREFVEDMPPYVKKLLEKAEAKFTDRVAKLEKLNAKTVETITAIHKKEIADLKAQKKDAVKAGDVDLVEKLDAELDKRRDDAPLTDDPKAKKAEAEKAFAEANAWYGSNKKMTNFAIGFSNELAARNPDLSYEDNIAKVLKEVQEEFPEYFEKKPAANGHAAVDSGGDAPPASRNDPFAKLSSIERTKAAEDMKKYPGVYPTKQSWLDAYTT